jgi:phage tail-like protein
MPEPGGSIDLLRGYQFRLIVDPANEAQFTSCSAPGARVAPLHYRQGGESQIVHLFAGPTEYSEVICKYGMTTSPLLWNWFQKSLEGNPERRNVSLVMLGASGVGERVRWNLNDAWPCEWRGAPLDALGKEIAIETLCLVYESLTRGGTP